MESHYRPGEHKYLHLLAPWQRNITNHTNMIPPIWNTARWGSGIKHFRTATKLEIVIHSFIDSLVEEGVVKYNHPLIIKSKVTRSHPPIQPRFQLLLDTTTIHCRGIQLSSFFCILSYPL